MNDLEQQISVLPTSFWGRAIFKFAPYKRQVIMANIDRVYGERLSLTLKII